MKQPKHYDLITAMMYSIFSGIMFAFREWYIAIGCLLLAVLWMFIYSVDKEVEERVDEWHKRK